MQNETFTTKISKEVAAGMRTYLASDEVKAQLAVFDTAKAENQPEPDFEVVISSETRDRHGEIISQAGINITNYMKSPVVLYGHFSSTWDLREGIPIVGYTDEIIKDTKTKQTIAKGRFIPKGISPIADQVRALYEAGMPMPTSVGGRVNSYDVDNEIITAFELMEWSFVVIPANPDAIAVARKAGVDIKQLVDAGILAKGFLSDIKEVETPAAPEKAPEGDETTGDDTVVEPDQETTTDNQGDAAETEPGEQKQKTDVIMTTLGLAEDVGAELAKMQTNIVEAMTGSARAIVDIVRASENAEGDGEKSHMAEMIVANVLAAQLKSIIEPLQAVTAALGTKADGDGGAEETGDDGSTKDRSKTLDGELRGLDQHQDIRSTLKAIANGASKALAKYNQTGSSK